MYQVGQDSPFLPYAPGSKRHGHQHDSLGNRSGISLQLARSPAGRLSSPVPSSLLSSTRMISFSRCVGVWLTALWTDRRITDRASFTKMKMMDIWGNSLEYLSSLHLGKGKQEGYQRKQDSTWEAGEMASEVKGTALAEDQGSGPENHIELLPSACNSSSRGIWCHLLASIDTCIHVAHIHTLRNTNTYIWNETLKK